MPIFGFSLESLDLRPKFTTSAAVFPLSQGPFVQRSLSVLLPVKDAQATLTALVHEILDLATDLGGQFELLIIDDGSTDATSEVAHELTHDYPQVRVVRHGMPLGREAAIRTGLDRSQGERWSCGTRSGVFASSSAGRRPNAPPAGPPVPTISAGCGTSFSASDRRYLRHPQNQR